MASFSGRIPIFMIVSSLALLSGIARADCPLPGTPPEMPQGASASDEEMREGREKLQVFVELLEGYEKCMDKMVADAPPGTPPEQRALWAAKSIAANDAAHQWADIYSAQLRAFKARQ
jgi:hypothetical protein